MTALVHVLPGAAVPDALIVLAVRRWRAARDARRPVQPALYDLLQPTGLDMLAPVLDSLMRLCERRFDRALCAGCPLAPSADETLLCRLLADPTLLDRVGGCRAQDGMDRAFAAALHAARRLLSGTPRRAWTH